MTLKERYKDALRINKGLTIVLTMIVLFFLLALASTMSQAAQTINCTPPVARTDSTPFDAATELQEYRWYVDGTFTGTSTACIWVLDQPDGTYSVTATSVDTGGREGPQSPGKSFTLTTAPPNPPILQ